MLAVLDGKDVDGMLHALVDTATEVVVTENSSPRRLPVAFLAARATEVLGPDRVTVEPDLRRAVRTALGRAARAHGEATSVLVTGSVVTAGEARGLLRSQALRGRTSGA